MAENKTKPTDASVEDYIASRANPQQRTDCRGSPTPAVLGNPTVIPGVGVTHLRYPVRNA